MMNHLHKFVQEEQGQDLVEYSLLIACVAMAAFAFMGGIKIETKGIFSTLASDLLSANGAAS